MLHITDRAATVARIAGSLLLAAGIGMVFTWDRFAAHLPNYQFFWLAAMVLVGKPLFAINLYRAPASALDNRGRVWRVIFLFEPFAVAAVAVAWWALNPAAIVGATSGH